MLEIQENHEAVYQKQGAIEKAKRAGIDTRALFLAHRIIGTPETVEEILDAFRKAMGKPSASWQDFFHLINRWAVVAQRAEAKAKLEKGVIIPISSLQSFFMDHAGPEDLAEFRNIPADGKYSYLLEYYNSNK